MLERPRTLLGDTVVIATDIVITAAANCLHRYRPLCIRAGPRRCDGRCSDGRHTPACTPAPNRHSAHCRSPAIPLAALSHCMVVADTTTTTTTTSIVIVVVVIIIVVVPCVLHHSRCLRRHVQALGGGSHRAAVSYYRKEQASLASTTSQHRHSASATLAPPPPAHPRVPTPPFHRTYARTHLVAGAASSLRCKDVPTCRSASRICAWANGDMST